ncbi:MAG: hypothetical protein KAH23_04870 [Kiritimatiellae bacterium]|nr:hypothetical protein [Kiritimatiellia bacterium]
MQKKCLLLLITGLIAVGFNGDLCFGQDLDLAIDALRKEAMVEAGASAVKASDDSAFTSGALGLQKLNPEISVTGDILWSYKDIADGNAEQDFLFRGMGLHLEAYLDPYTRFKGAASFGEHDVHLGEAYMTRFGVLPQVSITLGKFRQQFGVVNRWHKHALDQVDFPYALRQVFGEGGLNQTGVSLDWVIPGVAGISHELTLQLTDGENGRVFAGNSDNAPSSLAHYKLYKDLSDSTYAELGFSGLYGQNNEWQVAGLTEDRTLDASVVGVDFTLLWEPTHRMRYRNMTWRSEAYLLNKDILATDGSGEDSVSAWGAYSYLESKVSRRLVLGVRGDYFVPDTKSYADYIDPAGVSCSIGPIAVTEDDSYRWQVVPYVTWKQSPFVHFRVEYNHSDGDGIGSEESLIRLQCIFAAGPHKHERY